MLNLSLTCRALERVISCRLYNRVDVEIPMSMTLGWNTGGIPILRRRVLDSLEELFIRDGIVDVRDPVYNIHQRMIPGPVDAYICETISRIPSYQLKHFSYLARASTFMICDLLTSFRYMHRLPMSTRILDTLISYHGSNLRELRCYSLAKPIDVTSAFPQHLRLLECRSIGSGEAVGCFVRNNQKSLRVLKLGQDEELTQHYRRSWVRFMQDVPQPTGLFTSSLSLHKMPNLREVAFSALDVSVLDAVSDINATFFDQLESLTIESCPGSAVFLDCLAHRFRDIKYAHASAQTGLLTNVRLTSFHFRHEAPTAGLQESVKSFLASFSGLRNLSLLFENAVFVEGPSALITEHGPTLETLVLESRIQPRESLGLDTSRPFGLGEYSQQQWECIRVIACLCPNLVEFGITFPWNDETLRLQETVLPTLKRLKTFHIRNFPESHVLRQFGEYGIKEYSAKFVDWAFPSLVGGDKPALETLAIGPTLYESRWKRGAEIAPGNPGVSASTIGYNSSLGVAIPVRRQLPEFLRTHYFCVDWAKTRFGCWTSMITAVSERQMEEIREERPLGGVFEHVWLM